jgi:hypothetical protein
VVVAAGLTICTPPFGGKLYVLLSVPVSVICVALVAVTVKVDEFPAVIEAGLAEMLTVGGGFETTVLPPPHPLNSNDSARPGNSAAGKNVREKYRGRRILNKASPLSMSPGRGKTGLNKNFGSAANFAWGIATEARLLHTDVARRNYSSLTTGHGANSADRTTLSNSDFGGRNQGELGFVDAQQEQGTSPGRFLE